MKIIEQHYQSPVYAFHQTCYSYLLNDYAGFFAGMVSLTLTFLTLIRYSVEGIRLPQMSEFESEILIDDSFQSTSQVIAE